MDINRIYNATVSGKSVLLLTICGFVLIRLGWNFEDIAVAGSVVIRILMALLLMAFNRIFGLIRSHSVLPSVLYLLAMAIDFPDGGGFIPCFVSFCILLSYLFLFHSYRDARSEVQSLNISIILTLCSLFWSPVLFFFPVFWYGFYLLGSWNGRIIPASVLGYVSVYGIIFAYCVYGGCISDFESYLPCASDLFAFGFSFPTVGELIFFVLIFFAYVLTGIELYISDFKETTRAALSLRCLYLHSFFVAVFFLFRPVDVVYRTLIMFIPLSVVIGMVFARTSSTAVKYFLFFLILTSAVIAGIVSCTVPHGI